ncbi:MAG: hypothetical protein N0E48_04945, partial [Candidatus Thiodiazotropha endolucinida]|nr:hypothetical protein [Candidatus Thiodiazotropha taylori]MCW4342695.1 hypothetical protein [Candidatus Thiodiazotropha endolucinida]
EARTVAKAFVGTFVSRLALRYKSIPIKVVILKPTFSKKYVLTCRLRRPGRQVSDHKPMDLLNDLTRP